MAQSVFKNSREQGLILKVEPAVENMGLELRDLEILGAGNSTIIRVTVDSPLRKSPLKKAIEVGDCVKVHELLSPMFDVWDPVTHAYTLEVMSPGEKPALRLPSHFKEAEGQKIRFQTCEPVNLPAPSKPRRNWEGTLCSVDEDKGIFEVSLEDKVYSFSIDQVKNAYLDQDWLQKEESTLGSKKKSKKEK